MTKAIIKQEGLDSISQYNFVQLREVVNGRLSLDNLQGEFITGTTSNTGDTQKLFRHSFNSVPLAWLPVTGDIYVESLNSTTVDIRSAKTDVTFKIFVIK